MIDHRERPEIPAPRPNRSTRCLEPRRSRSGWVGALTALLLGPACDPFGTEFEPIEPAEAYRAQTLRSAPRDRAELVVMTYNVKFGGGRIDFFFDCHGDRVLMTEDEVIDNLEALARKIRQVDPDVLFLQEVDVNSKRAAYVDQLQWLLDHTRLNYGVYASQWRADFVPSDGIGPVDSGNAIASKYPLHDVERIALPLRKDLSGLDRYFYLKRNLLRARLDSSALGRPLWLLVTHTEAYSRDGTKLRHIELFSEELQRLSRRGLVLGGGDLNTLPPGSEQLSGFDDSACEGQFEADDYSDEQDWLEPLYDEFHPAIPLSEYQQDNTRYYTHTTRSDAFWNRKLDYLFSNAPLHDGLVHQDNDSGGMATMPLSDHAPLSATLRIDTP